MFIIVYHPNSPAKNNNDGGIIATSTVDIKPVEKDTVRTIDKANIKPVEKNDIKPAEETVQATSFVKYAKTLIGTPYVYGSVDPNKGLDCSGFVTCVSNHFDMKLPRSSVDFTNFGSNQKHTMPGPVILFYLPVLTRADIS